MNDIVLYCKSYRKDFLRLKRLLASIQQFNQDAIPFYVSTPQADQELLIQVVGSAGYHWVSDESIVAANPRVSLAATHGVPGGLAQAIIKSEFWRLGIAANYLCIDSDSIFIRDFAKDDFLAPDGDPYTVLHQNKDLFQMASNRGHLKVERDLRAEAERVQALFGRIGPRYYCAPAPFIWSSKVWQSFDQGYLMPKGITLWDAVTPEHPETLLYGEALLKYQAIPVRAIEPLFRIYHYDWQYYLYKRLGETTEKLKQNYMGVIYQSNWESEMSLGASDKGALSVLLKRIKRFGRYLQSYL
ncbi:MAG: DUF6492 family protein [Polynucleobacter sp.]|nr:DUF6492 family protein [Polynucleobacter sp.]MDZ4057246.1 DUF6492 family protein [Polynucleobacter sp.]